MGVVQGTHGYHHVTHTDVQPGLDLLLQPELLKCHLAAFLNFSFPFAGFSVFFLYGTAGTGMFKLNLGLHGPSLTEIVTQIYYGMRYVKSAVTGIIFIFGGV